MGGNTDDLKYTQGSLGEVKTHEKTADTIDHNNTTGEV